MYNWCSFTPTLSTPREDISGLQSSGNRILKLHVLLVLVHAMPKHEYFFVFNETIKGDANVNIEGVALYDSRTCTPCPPGSYKTTVKAYADGVDPAGKALETKPDPCGGANSGPERCERCELGKYSDKEDDQPCKECTPVLQDDGSSKKETPASGATRSACGKSDHPVLHVENAIFDELWDRTPKWEACCRVEFDAETEKNNKKTPPASFSFAPPHECAEPEDEPEFDLGLNR